VAGAARGVSAEDTVNLVCLVILSLSVVNWGGRGGEKRKKYEKSFAFLREGRSWDHKKLMIIHGYGLSGALVSGILHGRRNNG